MANDAHKNLTGTDLHESKGVATAAVSSVYVADGVGSGAWTVPTTAGLVFISSALVTGTPAQVDFVTATSPTATGITGTGTTVLDNTYDAYMFRISSLKCATDAALFKMRVGTGGTPTYQTSNYAYVAQAWNGTPGDPAQTVSIGATTTGDSVSLTYSSGLGNAGGENWSGTISFDNPEDTSTFHLFETHAAFVAPAPTASVFNGAGYWGTTGAITAVRFYMSSGNIVGGRITLYGLRKS